MDSASRARDAVAGMLEQSQMPQEEAARRATVASDADYWRRLEPNLTIEDPARSMPAAPAPGHDPALDSEIVRFQEDGYFQTPPIVAPHRIAAINEAIDRLAAERWPPVFAWVFDDLWLCARLPSIARLIESRLGAGYLQIPHIWVHVVPAVSGAAGWTPHFDGLDEERASVWIALTAATTDNGCMHIVPARLLPPAFKKDKVEGSVLMADAVQALRSVRALPAEAGSVLGWGFEVYHWGGMCVSPGDARRAISIQYLSARQTPHADEMPLVPVTGPLPPFRARLRMIGRAIHAYEKFEAGFVRYRGVADRLKAL